MSIALSSVDNAILATSNQAYPKLSGWSLSNAAAYTFCNVGIGLSNPLYTLSVNDTIQMQNAFIAIGAQTAPSFSWTQQSNTGIYRVNAGEAAISANGVPRVCFTSTGGLCITNGIERKADDCFYVRTNGDISRISCANIKNYLIPTLSNANNAAMYIGIGLVSTSPTSAIETGWTPDNTPIMAIGCSRDGPQGHMAFMPGVISFRGESNNIVYESMRITGSNVGIATSNPSFMLELGVDSAAKLTSSAWIVTSDERVKDNISNADLDRCYEIIEQLPLKEYTYDSNYIPGASLKWGWIAQDAEQVFPKAVNAIPSMYGLSNVKTLNTDQIYAAMYGAIQKLQYLAENLLQTI
jgi:hypothetical protein